MKGFQTTPPRVDRADVPLSALEERLRAITEEQARAVASVPDDRHLQHLTRPAKTTPKEGR